MLIQKCFHPIVQHHFYFGAYLSNYSYNSNLFWGDEKNWFQKFKKIIFSSHQNELSDVNKTYINISNGQKFELLIKCYTFRGGCDRGTCVSFTGHHFCICDPGWRGSNCNKCTPYWACPNQSDSACNQPNECLCDTGEALCNNPALAFLGTF